MRRLWRSHPWMLGLFVLALVLALGFTGAALWFGTRMENKPPPPVAAWMTPKYIVHTYHLPPEVVGETLGLVPGEAPRETLDELAKAKGLSVRVLIDGIEAAIVTEHGPQE